ncbi:Copper-transporting ATPase 1 [Blattella germanica]|nr:Copper-transporting ATPase 1 [Blattella germanica]
MALTSAVLSVRGMTCSSCTSTIESNIGQLEGIKALEVSLEKGEVYVTFQQLSKLSPALIAEKISDMGFEASVKQLMGTEEVIFYFTGGAKSSAEINLLKEKLTSIEGVEKISISPASDTVSILLKGLPPDVVR